MAYKKISDLTTASGYAAGDLIEMESAAGASVKSTFINAMLGNDGLDSNLEAGDAGKVSRYGIGVTAGPVPSGNDFNNAQTNGIYSQGNGTAANSPVPGSGVSVISYGQNATFRDQIGSTPTGSLFHRGIAGGAWSNWYKVWSEKNDGNAGQPPAPKAQTSVVGPGKVATLYSASAGASVFMPSGGTYLVWSRLCDADPTSFHRIRYESTGIVAGGYEFSCPGGEWISLDYWRQS